MLPALGAVWRFGNGIVGEGRLRLRLILFQRLRFVPMRTRSFFLQAVTLLGLARSLAYRLRTLSASRLQRDVQVLLGQVLVWSGLVSPPGQVVWHGLQGDSRGTLGAL